ncbi:MAG TPA: DUF202 domain-containing protein [Candidatus Baltobacteraceae bacterium]|nr:DUF202 domain-containing protein [Candidatus Baltobacteraceae bacterium]
MKYPELRATDVLANERTYLAYVRTALAFVAFGFVIARFSLFAREISTVAHIHVARAGSSGIFGTVMALLGIGVGIVGAIRYARAERALREGRVSSLAPKMAYVGAALIAAVGAFVAADLLSVR